VTDGSGGTDERYCRNCGVRLRRVLGRWWHTRSLGPVPCDRPEPEESQGPYTE
jgi:hypothetical protein